MTLGRQASAKRDWVAAAEHYRRALTRNPDSPPIWVQYGHALKESGRRIEAEAAYRRAIEGNPTLADTHLQLGHVLKLQGRGEEARAAYLRAAVLDPALADARRELAAFGLNESQIVAAGDVLPPLPPRRRRPSRITRADRARELGQWAEAARLYREALARNPRNAPIWVQYGHVLRQQGDLPAAETAYRRALAHDPQSADAHLQLGHALKAQGKTEDAQSAYLRAFVLEPRRTESLPELDGLGWAGAKTVELQATVDASKRTGVPVLATSVVTEIEAENVVKTTRVLGRSTDAFRFVYVSGESHTPGHIYRVLRPMAAAGRLGAQTAWMRPDEIYSRIAEIEGADAVVFWRAAWDEQIARGVEAARSAGAKIVFDVDDLMVRPE
ncbi:MAG: tetratricopeptide repeat protein, partial [Stellaceae bacterium]